MDDSARINIRPMGAALVIEPMETEITFRNQKNLFSKAGDAAEEREDGVVVMDFQRVRVMDSVGLGALASFKRRLDEMGREFRICRLEPQIRDIFSILKFTSIFSIFDTLEAALGEESVE